MVHPSIFPKGDTDYGIVFPSENGINTEKTTQELVISQNKAVVQGQARFSTLKSMVK